MSDTLAPEYIRIIKNSLSENRLAFFIGAGVSRATNPQYPLWTDISNKLKNGINSNDEYDPLKLAQVYSLKYGKLKLKETIEACFPKKDIPGEFQRSIFYLKPHYIISTNWDCLLENFIDEEISCPFDSIVCDEDLVQSKNDHKYIKMHGDLKHNNYVFTEDDYLNYSIKFPLIENFVKSIISTHTIVMLGYSFNDIDLKQIVNWFQNHSSVQPPIYMLVNKRDDYQQRYLEKFGIISFVIENKNPTETLRDFFRAIAKNENKLSQNPDSYIYNKINKFETYNSILHNHITNSLSNTMLHYDSAGKSIIHFCNKYLNEPNDDEERNIYGKFIQSINEESFQDSKIAQLLYKAGISGIITTKDEEPKQQYLSFNCAQKMDISSLIDFQYKYIDYSSNINESLEKILCLAQLGLYKEAFIENKRLIALCNKNKNYLYFLVSQFNHNELLNQVKFRYRDYSEQINSDHFIDIEESFITLPKDTQRICLEMKNFLTGADLLRIHFKSLRKVYEKEKNIQIVENGGMIFSSEENEAKSTLENLIFFVLKNGIYLENHSVFKETCKNYVKTSFFQKFNSKEISFSRIELFACIKYFSTEELKNLFKTFISKDPKHQLTIQEEDVKWFIDVALYNNVENFIQHGSIHSNLDTYIERILLITSLVNIPQNYCDKIFDLFERLVNEAHNTLYVFIAINSFLAIQWNLYTRVFDGFILINLIERILEKFVNNKTNGHENIALTRNRLSNLYNYCNQQNISFTSETLLNQIFISINLFTTDEEKMTFIDNVLLNLYQISDSNCKQKIKSFILKQTFGTFENFDQRLAFLNYNLDLVIFNIRKNKSEVIKLAKRTLAEYPEKIYYGSFETTVSMLHYLKAKYPEFKTISNDYDNKKQELDKQFNRNISA